eukprot:1182408-Lingulodinium_polyedra.AAC.1
MKWRAHGARARGAFRHAENANRAFDRIFVQLSKMPHNDAVKRAVHRFNAAKCTTDARTTHAP